LKPARIVSIDGLRCFAVSGVMAQHCWLLPFGWVGVWLFFVISGYVITLSLLGDATATSGEQYRRFILRRFWRIVPLYLLYLTLVLVVSRIAGRTGILDDYVFLLTFTYNWQMIYTILPTSNFTVLNHLWTLSIEEQFYVFFPLLFLFTSRRVGLAGLAIVVALGPLIRCLTSLSSQALSQDGGWIAFSVYANSICHFDAFAVGALMALLREPLQRSRRGPEIIAAAAIGAAVVYTATYVWINREAGAEGADVLRNIFSGVLYGQGREVFVYSVVTLIAAALVAGCIADRPWTRFLAWPPLVHVGKISYGAYVYHLMVIFLLNRAIGLGGRQAPVWERVAQLALVWSITVAVATISYRFFESRFTTRRRLLPASAVAR
jgi:peptidoglycan/LPS O-acetylase OafA/YrhL